MTDGKIVNSEGIKESEKRRRGAPKGARPVIWICASIIDDELICDKLSSLIFNGDNDNFSKVDAENIFKQKYNVDPKIVYGPFFDKKGGSVNKKKKRATLKMSVSELRFNGQRQEAIFNGWFGVANFLENSEVAAYFIFTHEVDPTPDKKKSVPSPKIVEISALGNAPLDSK